MKKLFHNLFYKQYGVRKLSDFIEPKVGAMAGFGLPIDTTLHHIQGPDVPAPDPSYPFIGKDRNIPLIVEDTYAEPTIGNPRKLPDVETKIRQLRKRYVKDYRIYRRGDKFTILLNKPIVYTYSLLERFYKYPHHRLVDLYKFLNLYRTYLENAYKQNKVLSRNNYLILDIHNYLKPYSVYLKLAQKSSYTMEHITLIDNKLDWWVEDIFRYLLPDSRKTSIFSKLPIFNNTIVLRYKTYFTLLDTKIFPLMLEDIPTEIKVRQVNGKQATKLFYTYLTKFVSTIDALDIKTDIPTLSVSDGTVDSQPQTPEPEEIEDTEETEDSIDIDKETDIYTEDIVETVSVTKPIDTILEIDDPTERQIARIEQEVETGVIDPARAKEIIATIKTQQNKPSPIDPKKKLKDHLTYQDTDFTIEDTEVATDVKTILDPGMKKTPLKSFDSEYLEKLYPKDIINVIYQMQDTGIIIEDHKVDTHKNVLGSYQEHTITVKPLTGPRSTIRFRIPTVDPKTGTISISGNKYILRKQKNDYPIRKISYNTVTLTSYYGKLFITRAREKRLDTGYWFYRQCFKLYKDTDKVKFVTMKTTQESYSQYPYPVNLYARYIKYIYTEERQYRFLYHKRELLLKELPYTLKVLEKDTYTLIGIQDNTYPILCDKEGNEYLYKNNSYQKIPTLPEHLDIDLSGSKDDTITIRIFNNHLPIVYVLLYYLGMDRLQERLFGSDKDKVRYIEKRSDKKPTDRLVRLREGYIAYDASDVICRMVFSGLGEYDIRDYSYQELSDKHYLYSLFLSNDIPFITVNELALLVDMFVDPITRTILAQRNDPTDFIGLLIKAVELLKTDFYRDPQDMTEIVIKGYERIPGMVYRNLIDSIRIYKNKEIYGRSRLEMDPFGVWKDINTDSAKIPYDTLNPIIVTKLREDVTYTGVGGRSKETINKQTRAYHPSDVGVFSEATKDSGDVGVNAYLSANPAIENLRGLKGSFDLDSDGYSRILSTSAMIAVGSIYDDPKRTNFISIQNTHIVPMPGYEYPYVATGYESVLPYRAGKTFVDIAEDDGIVISVSNRVIKVKYKDGNMETIDISTKPSKEESNAAYILEKVPMVSKGDKFKKDQVLAYNPNFFTPDYLNPGKVIYKTYRYLKTALVETKSTFEDSCALHTSVTDKLAIRYYKIKDFIVRFDQEVVKFTDIDTKVSPDTILLSVSDVSDALVDIEDNEAKAILAEIRKDNLKAGYEGVVKDMVVYYNGDKDDMSKTLKEFVDRVISVMKRKPDDFVEPVVTEEYAVKNKPLPKNHLHVKFYIEVTETMGIGDKGIFANQMKTTVGDVFTETITDSKGNTIEALFGDRSIQARIVNSVKMIGTTVTLLRLIEKKAIDIYRNG